jgi:transposase-like protein
MAKGKYEYWLTPEGLIKLEGWARDGLTDEQIAQNIGINPATLYDWKNKYDEISKTLKKGKEVVDYEVENALLKRALGYTVKEEKLTKDGEVVELEKEVPGDVTAQIFWLKNRKPDAWRDKPEETKVQEEEKESVRIELTRNGDKYEQNTDNS